MGVEARMPNESSPASPEHGAGAVTLAELLYYVADPLQRRKLEAYRIAYEKEHGLTDLTLRYTCTWPTEYQDWLIRIDPKRYYDGLPPFVKAWIKGKALAAAEVGRLDDIPDAFLQLYLSNQMQARPQNQSGRE